METIDNLPSSPLGVLKQFSISRTGVDVFSDGIIESVQNGEMNALELRAHCKAMESIIERVNKETQSHQLKEAANYPEDKFSAFGMEFTKADTYTKYDYSVCNDPVWNQLKKVLDSGNEQLKEREAFLKQVKKPLTELDEGSGEIITIQPPKVTRTAGLKVSMK
jgi:hypothetical protein